jgi:glucosamine--fructose-6-phosphate aminotransferase (isomerizing)
MADTTAGAAENPSAAAPRTAHPFARVARSSARGAERFVRLAARRRIILAGTGTSFHAAEIGEHLVRSFAGGAGSGPAPGAASSGDAGPDPRAVRAFDFALYGPRLGPGDAVVVVSHRGTKRYSVASLDRAREAGCPTALITGEDGGSEDVADVVMRTVPGERSSAHTVSFAGSVAALATLAARLRSARPEADGSEEAATGSTGAGSAAAVRTFLEEEVPAVLRDALGREDQVKELAARHADHRRIWIAGGGPAATAARETALKLKETSYIQAEGMATETMLHGPFQCAEEEDLFILIAPAGPARERTADLASAIRELGAPFLVVGDETAGAMAREAEALITVRTLPEPLSAFACVVPLQLLSYHLALVRGTDPDGFRLEDPRFARAGARVKL